MFCNNVSSVPSTMEGCMNQQLYCVLNRGAYNNSTYTLKSFYRVKDFFSKSSNDENFCALTNSDPA